MLQVRPRRPMKRPRAPEDHRCRQLQRQPLPVVELQPRHHRHEQDRHRQHRRDDQPRPQLPCLVGGLIRRVDFLRGERRRVPDSFDCGEEVIRRDRVRVEIDTRLLGRVVDGGGDAFELVELPLDPARARRTRHPLDRQLHLLEHAGHRSDLLRERHRVDPAANLELQKEAIAAGAREGRLEFQGVCVRMNVQEREIALAEGDEVALRAKVVLDVDFLPVPRHREAELGLLVRTGRPFEQADVEAVGGCRRRRSGEWLCNEPTVGLDVVGERVRRAVHREIGEDAVRARIVHDQRHRPGTVSPLHRMHVLEVGHVTADDDHVHSLRVLDVEVTHGFAALVPNPEDELRLCARACRVGVELQAEAVVGDGQPTEAVHAHRHRLALVRRVVQRRDQVARQGGGGKDQRQDGQEGGQLQSDAHAFAVRAASSEDRGPNRHPVRRPSPRRSLLRR